MPEHTDVTLALRDAARQGAEIVSAVLNDPSLPKAFRARAEAAAIALDDALALADHGPTPRNVLATKHPAELDFDVALYGERCVLLSALEEVEVYEREEEEV